MPAPIVVKELYDSRAGDQQQQTLRFKVAGTDDDAAVFSAVADESPPKHNGKERKSIEIEPQGAGLWFAEVEYEVPGVKERPDPEGGSETLYLPEVSFDTTGGTHHIEHSLQTVGKFMESTGDTAPDFGGLVGVNDGDVAGVDVVVPKLEWSERHYFVPGAITFPYIKLLSAATGTVNSTKWRGFDAGEVLFLGARGERSKPEMWTVEFGFAAMQNVVHPNSLKVGDIIVDTKKGWHHLWVHCREEVDESATEKKIVKKPYAVYVEKVYPEQSFSTLNLATPVMGQ